MIVASKIDKENSLFMVLFKQEVVQIKGSLTDKITVNLRKKRRVIWIITSLMSLLK